jgi:hypothetical protein
MKAGITRCLLFHLYMTNKLVNIPLRPNFMNVVHETLHETVYEKRPVNIPRLRGS